MVGLFKHLRDEIIYYATKEIDLQKTVKLCFEYLEKLNELHYIDTRYDLQWVHYEIALNSKKLEDYDTAIKHALISLNYLEQLNLKGERYAHRIWLIAMIYTQNNKIQEAIEMYYKCFTAFRGIGEENEKAMVIFNNAKLLKNFKAIKKVIKIYETNNLKTVINNHGDLKHENVLIDMYTETVELYLNEGMKEEALKLLYAINTEIEVLKNLRKELLEKLIA